MALAQGVDALLTESYALLTRLDLPGAHAMLEEALSCDFEHEELLCALKCARWWLDSRERIELCKDPLEAGDLCLARWRAFKDFMRRMSVRSERPGLAFKHYAFALALSRYAQLEKPGEASDPELSLRLGRAYKGIGDYEKALAQLNTASKIKKDDPAVLAELADTYGLIGEARASKALFREAFYINPQKIELDTLESDSVARLVDKAFEHVSSAHEASEWVPVYGELMGVFTVKRELKPMELSKLKQSVYEMETELASDGSRRSVLLPRLINRYFWLADCYINRREPKERIDEILLKIKLLDPNVYKLYIA
jgi:tetratricopeptide (TPR) repeat protein